MDLIDRHGAEVLEKGFYSEQEAINFIAENVSSAPLETMAVITLTEGEAFYVHRRLKDALGVLQFDVENRLDLLHRNSRNFKKGLTVTTFYLAKGLEFDRVYVLFPASGGDKDDPLVNQALYIAATRAMHELCVLRYKDES